MIESLADKGHTRRPNPLLLIVIFVFILLIVGAVGWKLGSRNNDGGGTNTSSAVNPSASSKTATTASVKSLINYTLPDAWKEGTCPNVSDRIYIVPDSKTLDCNTNPSAPIKVYTDPQNTTECEQLANPQNVRKHVCISLYIDGHKSLKATTEYLSSSKVEPGMTVSSYYISTSKDVARIDYTHSSSDAYQAAFDQFATSVQVK